MAEKDMEKAKRLNEVYKHVFAHYDIKSQKDFADLLHIQRTGLSAAMNGARANLTKNLFIKICAAFPGVFNLDYLWEGKGQLLTIEEEVRNENIEKIINHEPEIPDYVQNLCDQAAKVASRCEILEMQLSKALADNRELKEKLNISLTSIEGMKQQLATILQVFKSPNALSYYNNVLQGNMVSEERSI